MRTAYFTISQGGENKPNFVFLNQNLGFILDCVRVSEGSFGFVALDANGEILTGKFDGNVQVFFESITNNKLIADDGGTLPDYVNFICRNQSNVTVDGFYAHGMILIHD